MSAVLDIILIAVIVISAVAGMKKGFIKSVAGFVSHIVSFILTLLFYDRFAVYVKRLPFLANMITDVDMPELEGGSTFMQKIEIVVDHIISSEDVSAASEAIIKNYIADIIATVISFVVLLVGFILLFKLVFWLLDFAVKAPVVRQINGVMGLVFGVFIGLFWAFIFANLFGNILFPIFNAKWPEIFLDDMLDSVVFKLCTNVNPITYIFLFLKKLLNK